MSNHETFIQALSATLDHPHYLRAAEKTREYVETKDGTGLVLVVGPTGVGKSHLSNDIQQTYCRVFSQANPTNKQEIPVIRFTVPLLSQAGFNWGRFCEDLLIAYRHPSPKFQNLAEAREKIINAHTIRKPQTVIVDEAHNIFAGCKDDASRKSQTEVLKSLCEAVPGKFTLVGTYDLDPWFRTNGQTVRRNRVVHFPRYTSSKVDQELFAEILAAIQTKCGQWLDVSLVDRQNYVFEGCIGLVGILRNWLMRAKTNAMKSSEDRITATAMEESRMSAVDLTMILRECLGGEHMLTETEDDRNGLRDMLHESYAHDPELPAHRAPVARHKIRRSPKRDPVGAFHEATIGKSTITAAK